MGVVDVKITLQFFVMAELQFFLIIDFQSMF